MIYSREQIEEQADSEPRNDYSDESIMRMMLAQLLAENDALQKEKDRADFLLTVSCNKEGMIRLYEDSARWREAIKNVGAENQLGGARYVIRGLEAPRNVMQGSVAEHFTKTIDAARAKGGA